MMVMECDAMFVGQVSEVLHSPHFLGHPVHWWLLSENPKAFPEKSEGTLA